MSPQTTSALASLSENMHWGNLMHPEDMERFRTFVIAAYQNGDHGIALEDFMDIAGARAKASFESEVAKKKRVAFLMYMHERYEDGIKLLKKFEGK